MNQFKTEQEKCWAGEFGTEYIERNQGDPKFPQDDITWFLMKKCKVE
jgi:hypothetical protein